MRSGESVIGRIITWSQKTKEKFRILGTELAGEIESVGKDVRDFRQGDQVYGFRGFEPALMPNINVCLKKGRWPSNRPI